MFVARDKERNSDMESMIVTVNVTIISLALLGLLVVQEPTGVGR